MNTSGAVEQYCDAYEAGTGHEHEDNNIDMFTNCRERQNILSVLVVCQEVKSAMKESEGTGQNTAVTINKFKNNKNYI